MRTETPDEVAAILAELRRRLEALYADRLRGLWLYGSYARGDARPGSDLDVLVVLDEVEPYRQEIERTGEDVAELSLEHEASIGALFAPERRWPHGATPFLENARTEGRAA